MATFNLRNGQNPVTYFGTTTVALSSLPWYIAANVKSVLETTGNGAGYSSGVPGNMFGVTSLKPGYSYVFITKQIVPVDAALFAPSSGSNNPIAIPLDGTTVVAGETIFDATDQAASFNVSAALTAAFSQGSGTVQVSTDNGTTWVELPTTGTDYALAANTQFTTRVLHAAGVAFYAIITATF